MSQTTYNRVRSAAVAGMLVDLTECVIESFVALEDIPPGRMVEWNASSKGIQLPQGTGFSLPVGMSCFDPTNMQPAIPAAGFVYKLGDMVPVLRRGKIWAAFSGGTPALFSPANVKHSSTVATNRGMVTASATSSVAGSEIAAIGPSDFRSLEGPTGLIQVEVSLPGQTLNDNTRLTALEADAATTHTVVPLNIAAAYELSTGLAPAVFADAEAAAPGTEVANAKCPAIRWNDHATPAAIIVSCPTPADMDNTANVTFHALVSKVGATAGDATKLTVGAFMITPGALCDADADFGGDTGAVVGTATSKTVTELTLALAFADVDPGPSAMAFTIKPKAGTLGTDDFVLHAAWLSYTRLQQTS